MLESNRNQNKSGGEEIEPVRLVESDPLIGNKSDKLQIFLMVFETWWIQFVFFEKLQIFL